MTWSISPFLSLSLYIYIYIYLSLCLCPCLSLPLAKYVCVFAGSTEKFIG